MEPHELTAARLWRPRAPESELAHSQSRELAGQRVELSTREPLLQRVHENGQLSSFFQLTNHNHTSNQPQISNKIISPPPHHQDQSNAITNYTTATITQNHSLDTASVKVAKNLNLNQNTNPNSNTTQRLQLSNNDSNGRLPLINSMLNPSQRISLVQSTSGHDLEKLISNNRTASNHMQNESSPATGTETRGNFQIEKQNSNLTTFISELPSSESVRLVIANYWPEILIFLVIIIYLSYYFKRISKKPKLIGQNGSKFVQFIERNLKENISSRFSPLIYFWGTNAQTALFGYLQGQTSLTNETRNSLIKRQFLYVSDLQYLTSNKDLSRHYESAQSNKDNKANRLEARPLKIQLRALESLPNPRDPLLLHRGEELVGVEAANCKAGILFPHKANETSIFHAIQQMQNNIISRSRPEANNNDDVSSQQHENIRLALEGILVSRDQQHHKQRVQATLSSDESSPGTQNPSSVGKKPCCCSSSNSSSSSSSGFSSSSSASDSDSGLLFNSQTQAASSSTISLGSSGHVSSGSGYSSAHSTGSLRAAELLAASSRDKRPPPLSRTASSTSSSSSSVCVENSYPNSQSSSRNSCMEHNSSQEQLNILNNQHKHQTANLTINLTQFERYSAKKCSSDLEKERLEFGQCALDWFVQSHPNYHKNKLVALISAGMTTGSDKGYVTETVKTLQELGYECCVFIRRGVGGLKLSSAKFFSPAKWRDFEAAVQSVREQRPGAQLVAIGFSFGSIELCRYLAMSGRQSLVDAALLVSCPFDPVCGGENMHNGSYLNKRIDAYLAKNLGKQLYEAMLSNSTVGNESASVGTANCRHDVTGGHDKLARLSGSDSIVNSSSDQPIDNSKFKSDSHSDSNSSMGININEDTQVHHCVASDNQNPNQHPNNDNNNNNNNNNSLLYFMKKKQYNNHNRHQNQLSSPSKKKPINSRTKSMTAILMKKRRIGRQRHLAARNINELDNANYTTTTTSQIWTNENGSSINLARLPKLKSLHDFEYRFNRVVQHYPNKEAYAQDCELDLSTIAIPTLCLSSEDDFMAPLRLLPLDQIRANENLCMLLTKRGGHMAFIDGLWWPKKPYFAQRIIHDYMAALKDSFRNQLSGSINYNDYNHNQHPHSAPIKEPATDANQNSPTQHIAVDLHHHHHHHHYLHATSAESRPASEENICSAQHQQ